MKDLRRHWMVLIELAFVLGTLAVQPARATMSDESLIGNVIAHYGFDTAVYQVEVVSTSITTTDLAPSEINFTALSDKEPLGLFTVLATATRNNAVIDRGQVRLRIRKFAEVPVLSRAVKFHQTLDRSLVEVKRMEVTNLREQPLSAGDDPSGYRAKRMLAAGQILTNEAMEPVPAIESGSEVAIEIGGTAFNISAEGIALQDGARGDQIKVKNTTSGRILMARVVDDRRVTVER